MESALILPVIFIFVVSIVLVSLWVYEHVVLYQRANMIADRISHVWDNSHKDATTGTFDIYSTTRIPSAIGSSISGDGLYWRLFDDHLLHKFIQIDSVDQVSLDIGEMTHATLATRKMSRSSQFVMHDGVTGRITFTNEWSGRHVHVELERVLPSVSLLQPVLSGASVRVSTQTMILEPVEIVRTTDLLMTYAHRLKEFGTKIAEEAHQQHQP